jgi:uncharacterized protein with von Willebrand factor type A (vWA) domain
MLLASGCESKKKRPRIIVALDVSGSTVPERGSQLNALDEIVRKARQELLTAEIWTFHAKSQRVIEASPNINKDLLNTVKRKEMSVDLSKKLNGKGTLLSKLFSTIKDDITNRLNKQEATILVLLTDGGIDENPKLVKSALGQLMKDFPNLQLVVCGIESSQRGIWNTVVDQHDATRFSTCAYQTLRDEIVRFAR